MIAVLIIGTLYENSLPYRNVPSLIFGEDISAVYEFTEKEGIPLYTHHLRLVVAMRIIATGIVAFLSGCIGHFISTRRTVSQNAWTVAAVGTCALSMFVVCLLSHGDKVPLFSLILLVIEHIGIFAVYTWGVRPKEKTAAVESVSSSE